MTATRQAAFERPTADTVATLLNPGSVAIIGASTDAANLISSASLSNLESCGYSGQIYPVNPRHAELGGRPCYPSVGAIPEPPDTAIIVVPAPAVRAAVQDCIDAGVGSVTIVSGGVDEAALAGLPTTRTRVLGPEAVGVINVPDHYVSRAAANHFPFEQVTPGGLAIVTQSGAACNTLFNLAVAKHAGVAFAVNTGRSRDLTIWDFAAAAADDARVTAVIFVAEGIGDPARFAAAARRCRQAGKPLVGLVVGYSEAAREAVRSHSGGLAGSKAVHAAAFARLGVVSCQGYEELIHTAMLFDRWGARRDGPPPAEPGLAIVSFSGGEAALLADHAAALGVPLRPPGDELARRLSERLPEITPHNPLDPTTRVLSDPDRVAELFGILLAGGTESYSETLAALPVYAPQFAERRVAVLRRGLAGSDGKRIAVSTWAAPGLTEQTEALIRAAGFTYVGNSLETLSAYRNWASYVDRPAGPAGEVLSGTGDDEPPISTEPASSDRPPADLTYSQARATLAAAGLPFAATVRITGPEQAAAAVGRLGVPVVVKADVSSVTHKNDIGAVRLGCRSGAEVVQAIASITGSVRAAGLEPAGFVVEQQASGYADLIIGGHVDPEFGPVVVFGSGGSGAETLADSAVDLVPLGPEKARPLLAGTRIGRAILAGAIVDADVLESALESFAAWFAANWRLYSGVDINPVRVVSRRELLALDARIEVSPQTSAERKSS
jgi:acyl-CoA synthetase (NDP forming)